MADLSQSGIMPLENLYLLAITKCAEQDKLSAVLQDFGGGACRIWLVPDNTTVPNHQIELKFERDKVVIAVASRNESKFAAVVGYVEGIDTFCKDLQKHIRRGLLGSRRAA